MVVRSTCKQLLLGTLLPRCVFKTPVRTTLPECTRNTEKGKHEVLGCVLEYLYMWHVHC
jgi:hypothetical protein